MSTKRIQNARNAFSSIVYRKRQRHDDYIWESIDRNASNISAINKNEHHVNIILGTPVSLTATDSSFNCPVTQPANTKLLNVGLFVDVASSDLSGNGNIGISAKTGATDIIVADANSMDSGNDASGVILGNLNTVTEVGFSPVGEAASLTFATNAPLSTTTDRQIDVILAFSTHGANGFSSSANSRFLKSAGGKVVPVLAVANADKLDLSSLTNSSKFLEALGN